MSLQPPFSHAIIKNIVYVSSNIMHSKQLIQQDKLPMDVNTRCEYTNTGIVYCYFDFENAIAFYLCTM